MLASRSATASESSANAGSKTFNGKGSLPSTLRWADSRKEEREEGRRGVVGRDRDVERGRRTLSWPSFADIGAGLKPIVVCVVESRMFSSDCPW